MIRSETSFILRVESRNFRTQTKDSTRRRTQPNITDAALLIYDNICHPYQVQNTVQKNIQAQKLIPIYTILSNLIGQQTFPY